MVFLALVQLLKCACIEHIQITEELMRDIHQKVEGGAEDGSARSSDDPLTKASANLQQERRAAQLTGSESELLHQLEEERLQVCVLMMFGRMRNVSLLIYVPRQIAYIPQSS